MHFYSDNKGSIIIFSILVVSVILVAAITTISVLVPKIRLARDTSSSVGAIFAADSAIEWCIYESRNGGTNVLYMQNGATYEFKPPIVTCAGSSLDHSVTGTYQGISRALEVSE